MSSPITIAIYAIVGVAGVIALWLPVMLIAALFSGWWELARAFPRTPPAPRATRGVGSLYLSPIFRYKGFVAYAIDDDHLHLAMPPILGAFHPPMSIPWAAIHFFRGDDTVLGLIPIEVNQHRMLVSKSAVKHELKLRQSLETPEVAADHNPPTPPTDQKSA